LLASLVIYVLARACSSARPAVDKAATEGAIRQLLSIGPPRRLLLPGS